MADNWYIVLELSFDPPEEDEGVILKRIDEKKKFWASHFNDFKNGAQYRAWSQSIPKITRDMVGDANIRKQLAAEAAAAVYGPLDDVIKRIGRKGNITSVEADRICKRMKVDLATVKKRAAQLGIKWTEGTDTDYKAIVDKYYTAKPAGAANYDTMAKLLETFHVDNLYDFLYAGTTVSMKDVPHLPPDTLRSRAKEKKDSEFKKNDSVSGTGSKLCFQCDLIFKDENTKKAYDEYLEYMKRKKILDDAKDLAYYADQVLTPEQGDEIIGQLVQVLRDRKLAEKLLIAFCKVNGIVYSPAADSAEKNEHLKVCRCGCLNDVSDGRKVCSNCGLPLTIRCPKCNEVCDCNIRVCKCGFRFENIDRAMAICELADHAIDTLDFTVAQAHLSDAERYWPGNDRAAELKRKLADYQKRVGQEVAKMRDAIRDKLFCEAKRQYETIRKLFSGYSDPDIEETINNAIQKAQELLSRARASRIEKEILELCAQAYDVCGDLPGVRDLMPAPPAVTGFKVTANPRSHTNSVSWASTGDKSIRYVVVRSVNGWIQSVGDGDQVYRGSASSYVDKDIEPAVVYYYNVFAERAGIFSKGAQGEFKEICNLFEISNVNITPSDGSLNITWDPLPKNSTAEIYIVENNNRKHIISCPSGSYLVTNLANEHNYTFHIALSYFVGGKKVFTEGVDKIGTPVKPPQPIETLRIKPRENFTFDAVWDKPEGGEVRLYASTKKPDYFAGDTVALSVLESQMQQIQQLPLSGITRSTLTPAEEGCSFRYDGTDVLHVVAVVVKGGAVVFGSLARACNGDGVTVKDVRIINGKISIFVDPPKNASGFVVLYRHDTFPTDISDTNTVRKYVPIKQYQLNSALLIDSPEEERYFFSVYAEFRYDGETEYSAGADYLFDNAARLNITYSITVNKRLFGDSSVTLVFEADVKPFVLPEIEVMSAVGNTPMFKKSASLFCTIPSQQVDSTLPVKILMPKGLSRNTYIKAFFKNDADQARNQLRLKLGSSYQIS